MTLIVPGDAPTLWQLLWANVPARENALKSRDFPRVFPWLAPAAGSKSGHVVTPENAHGLQCWWGMPRRIRLDFTALETPRACGLTGEPDSVQVATWRQRPHGANYTAWGKIHPLTPHYQPKNSQEWLPVHPQPGGIGYRDWLGLVLKSEDGSRIPAAVVPEWRDVRGRDAGDPRARILAAGFDMDNMKARSFIESELPLPAAPTEAARDAMDDLAKSLVESANQVASLARNAVRDALFDRGATVKADALPFNTVRERLWEQTEASFFTALEKVARQPDTMGKTREEWLKMLRPLAFSLFDEAAPLAPDTDQKNAARIAQARKFLGFALHGYGKAGNDLFGKLNLNLPETKQVKPKGRGA